MFENYKATKQDFEAIEEGIKTVWHLKLNFVFKNKELIKKVIVVSYDSKNLYLWSKTKFTKFTPIKCSLKQYFAYQIPHKLKISDDCQHGWRAGLWPKKLTRFLLSKLKTDEMSTPFISGGLLTPFIELQKKMKDRKDNPYITRESYLATIIHEFGHVYWHQHKLWYYSNKQENLLLLKTAKRLYSESTRLSYAKSEKLSKMPLRFPAIDGTSELFACCADYQASMIFWPTHKRNCDIFAVNVIEYLLKLEKLKNLDQEDSVLEPRRYPHDFALVFSKIILTLYPKTWPQFLIAPTPNLLHIPS
ncbi:MAG: hypothetical protein V1808_04920 [Candidatus Daviesbacteria bacterium]